MNVAYFFEEEKYRGRKWSWMFTDRAPANKWVRCKWVMIFLLGNVEFWQEEKEVKNYTVSTHQERWKCSLYEMLWEKLKMWALEKLHFFVVVRDWLSPGQMEVLLMRIFTYRGWNNKFVCTWALKIAYFRRID